jgi:hypothetical protein
MESGDCFQHLKRSILSIFPLDNLSLTELIEIFSPAKILKNDFFSKAGNYSSSFAFICNGIMQSHYDGHADHEIIKNLFVDNMFVIPLPSFLYRKPSYLNYKAVTDINLLQAKFNKLEELALKYTAVNKFVKILIDREWIIKRELHESSLYIYNNQTRFRIFVETYHPYLEFLEPALISSYLQIPVKQVEKFIKAIKPSGKD